MKLYYFVSPIVLISLILPTEFFGDLTHQNEDCALIQEEITTPLSDHSPLASTALMGQKYRFKGGGGNDLYTNPANWDDVGDYAGYPGTDVPLGDTIESIAVFSIPSGTTLNLDCYLNLQGNLKNYGIINFNYSLDKPIYVMGVENYAHGQIFINGILNTDYLKNLGLGTISISHPHSGTLSFSPLLITNDIAENEGHLIIEKDGILEIHGEELVNRDKITVKNGGQVIDNEIDNRGAILNDGTIISTILEGTLIGNGEFVRVLDPDTVRAGGQGDVGTMKIHNLELTSSSVLEIEVADNPTSGDYDQIIIENPVSLTGHLEISGLGNFQSTSCEQYTLIQFLNDSPTGNFRSISASNLGDYDWRTSIIDTDVMFHLMPGETANNALDFHASDKNYVHINHDLGTIRTIEFKFFPNVVDPDSVGDNIINFNYDAFSFIWTMNTTGSLSGETLTILNTNSGNNRLWTNFEFKRQWYHVSIVSENGSTYDKIYIDGVDIQAQIQGNGPSLFTLDNFNIGGRDPRFGYASGFFDGRMDEFRFWSVTRNEESIEDYWYQELDTFDMEGLMAYYKFDHGLAYQDNTCNPLLVDYSGNRHHGHLNDFDLMDGRSNWVRAQVCPSSIPVATNMFTGESSTNQSSWSDPDNWSLGQVPGSCHHVVIPDGFNVLVDIPWAVCYTLQVDGSLDTQHFQFESFAPGE